MGTVDYAIHLLCSVRGGVLIEELSFKVLERPREYRSKSVDPLFCSLVFAQLDCSCLKRIRNIHRCIQRTVLHQLLCVRPRVATTRLYKYIRAM